jgi:hypothetical protein
VTIPTDITGLKLWLKADSLALSDGAAVTSWTDSSGLGNHAVTGDAPTFKTNIVNGLPIVRFNGSSNYLDSPASASLSALTVFVVAKRSASAGTYTMVGAHTSGGGLQFRMESSDSLGLLNEGIASIGTSSGTVSPSVFNLLHADLTNASAYHFFINNVAAGNSTTGVSLSTGQLIRIGMTDSSTERMNGDIAEIVLYDSVLNSTDRTAIAGYLLGKYALAGYGMVALSTTHTLSAAATTPLKAATAALVTTATLTPVGTTNRVQATAALVATATLSPSGAVHGAVLFSPPSIGNARAIEFLAGSTTTSGRVPQATADAPMLIQATFMGFAKVIPGPITIPAGMDLRVASGVTIAPVVPAIVLGKPLVPDYWAKTDSTMTATGAGGLVMIPDPDPYVGNPNPGGLAPKYTWHVNDLSTSPVGDWPPVGGTGPHWVSGGGFRPILRSTVVYGAGDKYHTYTRGLHFDGADVEHMTLDWGSNLSQPFTVIICGIIHWYPYASYGHYLFDSGKPVSTGLADGNDHTISEGLSYRSLMLYRRDTAVLATHTGADPVRSGKHVITRADYAPRPKMFFGIFNGSSSYIGAWDNRNKYIKKGTVDNKSPRYFVTGRSQNHVSDELASHQTMFEMRMFDSAVSLPVLKEIYKQLAATWKFNLYHV